MGTDEQEFDPREAGVLCDDQIAELAMVGMIEPFIASQVKEVKRLATVREITDLDPDHADLEGGLSGRGETRERELPVGKRRVVSYGLTSYGYDMRVGGTFKVFTNGHAATIIDPKDVDEHAFFTVEKKKGEAVIVPPNSFVLGHSVEHFDLPRDVFALVVGKSTYARCGIIVNCTPMEPAWRGHLTIEISNSTPLPVKVYAHEGIAQAVFFRGRPCHTSYEDRSGKYQDQPAEVVLPRMKD